MGWLSEIVHFLEIGGATIAFLAGMTTFFFRRAVADHLVRVLLAYAETLESLRAKLARNSRVDFKVRSFVLDLLLPMKVAKDAQASIEDMFPTWLEEYGLRKARFIRGMQIARIIIGHHCVPVLAFGERILKIVRSGKAS